jgi:hypothetical protein
VSVTITPADKNHANSVISKTVEALGWPAVLAILDAVIDEVRNEAEGVQPTTRGRQRLAGAADHLERAMIRLSQVLDDEDLW